MTSALATRQCSTGVAEVTLLLHEVVCLVASLANGSIDKVREKKSKLHPMSDWGLNRVRVNFGDPATTG